MISKIYFTIISFFVFIFLFLFIGFIVLQNGLFLNELSISNIHIKQLYIKWNKKLDVSIFEIKVSQSKTSIQNPIDYKELGNSLRSLSRTSHWFNSLVVEKISYKDITASFKYNKNTKGFLLASSDALTLDVALSKTNDTLLINIKKIYDKKRDITLQGNTYIDTRNIKFYSDLTINVSNELNATLYLHSDTKTLHYKVVSNKDIVNYKHTISLMDMPKEAKYWAYDAIEMSHLTIESAYGHIDYNNTDDILKQINITATVHKLHYTYNKDLDAIHTKDTKLEFKNGFLYIYPHQAYTSGKYLGESWLKLDFTQKEELLTLNLLFDSILDNAMLKILNTYKIKLPFLQKTGVVKTDLSLEIGLRELHVKAKGNFYTKKANFDYLGLNIDIYDANILLNNYDVSIKGMEASYKDIAKASVDVRYNASTDKGEIDFLFNYISTQGLSLDTMKSPLSAQYTITKNKDLISIEPSLWNFKEQTIKIDAIEIPFDLKDLKLKIPTTFVKAENLGSAFISGQINLHTMTAQFNADILKFSYEGVNLSQSNTPLKIEYDKKLSIFSKNEIFFNISGSNYKASNFYLEIDDDKILLKHTKLNIGKYITTKIYANFNTLTNKSHISLSNFILIDPNTQSILYKNKKIMLSLTHAKNIIKIRSNELSGEFSSQEKGWKLKLNSLSRIVKGSSLLKKLHLDKGDFTLYKNKNNKYTKFKANIEYPYKILVKNNIPQNKYKVKGKIYQERISLSINNKVFVNIKDTIDITMKNTSVNINELLRVITDSSTDSNSSNTLNLILKASNSRLYVNKNRFILYDTLDVQFYNKILTAQLNYAKGVAGLRFKDNNFHLYGKNFNDKFMTKIFILSKFNKGNLDFSLSGKLDDYKGVIYIKDTTINDYKILNNILAFVNTIPSLVTFALPGYNKEGLFINKAYINFNHQNNVFNLSDIYLDSKEIDVLGSGVADLEKDTIDITLNLKTDLGSDLAKVPLIGYIILDKDSISTTLNIKGKASDPTVKSLIAEDIVVAPLNIIKRTLSLPYIFIKDAIDKK